MAILVRMVVLLIWPFSIRIVLPITLNAPHHVAGDPPTSWLVISCYIPMTVGFRTHSSLYSRHCYTSAGHYHEPPAWSRITVSSCAAKCSKGAMSLAPVSPPPTQWETRLCCGRWMSIPFQSWFGNRQLHSFPSKMTVYPARKLSIDLSTYVSYLFSICLST